MLPLEMLPRINILLEVPPRLASRRLPVQQLRDVQVAVDHQAVGVALVFGYMKSVTAQEYPDAPHARQEDL